MTFIKPDRDLIAKYNISGPRYTSYPTALQFGPFSSDDYRQSVRESVYRDKSISLYCHLPFCATICYYCACNKIVTKDRSRARHYLDLLKKEIELQAPLFTGRKVSQLHWGGGTPTFLSDDELKELMAAIKDQFPLIGDDEGEFSIEVDPRTVNPQRIELLRSIGFNRLSMGIQDFNESVQKAVNRLQTFDDTKAVITSARKNGFRSISVDLMYGLPFQTLDSVSQTLDQVISLDPDRVSIYNYAHLPDRFKSQRRIDALDLPAASTKLDILMLCIMKLGEAGYIYIGMDHFAKPDDELAVAQENGSLHRNFQGYSTFSDRDLVALGITGISNIGHSFAQNAKDLEGYEEMISKGLLATEKGVLIDRDDQIRRAVIMKLICQFELIFEEFDHKFDINFEQYFSVELKNLNQLAEDGLLCIEDRTIRITETGRLLARNICMTFDRYLGSQAEPGRYSRAI